MSAPCDYCKGTALPGIHLPTDFDDREPSTDGKVWVARCDECGTYGSDVDAAEAVSKATGWPVLRSYDRNDEVDMDERAGKAGTEFFRPYFAVTIHEAEKAGT